MVIRIIIPIIIAQVSGHVPKKAACASKTYSIKEVQSELDNLLVLARKGFITADKYKSESTPLEARLKDLHNKQVKTALRTRNWYEVVGKTLEKLTNANEKVAAGRLNEKVGILVSIGQNPVFAKWQIIYNG